MGCKSCKSSGIMNPDIKTDENLVGSIIKYSVKTLGFLIGIALLPLINLAIIWFMFETIVLNKDIDLRSVINKYITDKKIKKEEEEEDEEDDDDDYDLTEDDVIMLNVEDITLELWEKIYEKLFGGFEDLSSSALEDEEEKDELEFVAKEHKTKQGYLKDGFVVDSDAEEDYTTEEEDEEVIAELKSDDTDESNSKSGGSELSEESYEE